jgi:hypothetical protein
VEDIMRALPLLICLAVPFLCSCSTAAPYERVAFMEPGKCGLLARQRLDDAIAFGYARATDRAVFDYSYRACVDWERKGLLL